MKNWVYNKHGFLINWFNVKNDLNYTYNNKDFFKKVFHCMYNEYGIEFVHMWNTSHLLWQTSKSIYWLIFRKSERFEVKGKWCFKLMKTTNDHTSCG